MEFPLSEWLDVEEELVRHAVRSNKLQTYKQTSSSRSYKNEISVIPLLVKDIQQLSLVDRCFEETLTAYGLVFSSALMYGRISSGGAGANGKLRYYLDDGTGVMQVRLIKKPALKDLTKLHLQCARTLQNKENLYSSVENILKTARRQLLDIGTVSLGTKALLIGRPYKSFEEVVFMGFEMIIDSGLNRDFEIAVKNFIVDWYVNRYRGHQLQENLPS